MSFKFKTVIYSLVLGMALLAGPYSASAQEVYEYDDLSRLIRVTYPNGEIIEYAYDPGGNRLLVGITNAAESAPVTRDDEVSVLEDDPVGVTLDPTTNDSDPESGALTLLGVGQAKNGTTSFSGSQVTYIADADFSGTDSFYYTIKDIADAESDGRVIVTVTPIGDIPVATAIPDQTASEGVPFQFDANSYFSDPDVGDTLTFSVSGATWLSIADPATAVLTGTPPANSRGTSKVTITATDASGSKVDAPLNIIISPSLIVWFDTSDENSITQSGSSITAFSDKSGNGYNATPVNASNPPNHITLSSAFGYQELAQFGTSPVRSMQFPSSSLLDQSGVSAQSIALLLVAGSDVTSRQVVLDLGTEQSGLAVYIEGGKVRLSAWDYSDTNNTWKSTPTDIGVVSGNIGFMVLSFDGKSDGTGTFTTYGTTGNALFTDTNVKSLPAQTTSPVLGEMRGGMRFDGTSETGTGRPFGGMVGELRIFSHALTAAEVAILKTEFDAKWLDANGAPIAMDDGPDQGAVTSTNTDLVGFDPLANDSDPEGEQLKIKSAQSTTGTPNQSDQGGTIAVAGNGLTLTYTPPASFTGIDTFKYTIQDEDQTSNGGPVPNEASATITVSVSNQPPTLVTAIPDKSTLVNQLLTFNVAANFSDPESAPLTFSLVSAPSWLSINGTTGDISGTPSGAQAGISVVRVGASDGFDQTTDDLVVTVTKTNQAPQVASAIPTLNTYVGNLFSYDTAPHFSDADGDPLTYSLVQAPSWLSIDSAAGQIYGMPGTANIASSTVQVRASDGTANVDTSFTLNANAVPAGANYVVFNIGGSFYVIPLGS